MSNIRKYNQGVPIERTPMNRLDQGRWYSDYHIPIPIWILIPSKEIFPTLVHQGFFPYDDRMIQKKNAATFSGNRKLK